MNIAKTLTIATVVSATFAHSTGAIAAVPFGKNSSTTQKNNQVLIAQASYEVELLQLVNNERLRNGLQSLTISSQLSLAAQSHAQDMQTNNYFSHSGQNGSNPSTRAQMAGYSGSSVGENIAAGYPSASATFQGWMNSPGHRANILNPNYRETGIGLSNGNSGSYGNYWVQVFATPQNIPNQNTSNRVTNQSYNNSYRPPTIIKPVVMQPLVANPEPTQLKFQLPFPKGQCYLVIQGNNSRQGTHNDLSNRYAWDFSMPKGTPISASAPGQVVLIKDGSDGKDKSIVIQHDDRYHTLYTHLNSVEVAVGDIVTAGQRIGTGGWNNTIASHIHYLVITRRLDGITAIPSRFIDVTGDGIPKEDKKYCAKGGDR